MFSAKTIEKKQKMNEQCKRTDEQTQTNAQTERQLIN